jgi:phage terminase small subunit
MNERQRAFADYYIECGNAAEAARRAGYSEKTAYAIGSENLTKPEISEYIEMRLREMSRERIASADEVMEFYTSVMRGQAKEPKGKAAYLKTRIAAAKEIMKRHAAVTDSRNDSLKKLDELLAGITDAARRGDEECS